MRSTQEVLPDRRKPVNTNTTTNARIHGLWDKEQAADFYGISVRTLELKMAQKAVPFIKLGGGAVRFHPDVLNDHAKQNCTVTGGRK